MYRFLNSYIRLLFLFIALIFIQTILFINKASAFSDDFTSDPRTNPSWTVQNEIGLTHNSPGITLTSNQSGSFPYLKTSTSNNLSSDKYFEIVFQYLYSGSTWGVGGSFTDNAPNFPTYLGTVSDYLNYNISYFWGDQVHAVTSLCPVDTIICPNTWWFIYPNSSPSNFFLSTTVSDYGKHTFSMLRRDVGPGAYSYKIYFDSIQIFESQSTSRLVNAIWLGHPSNIGGSKDWPILKIFSVRSLPETPSAFPYLSQKDPLWGSTEYDSATSWAGIEKSGIDRWGCALTSVAMMLQKYKVRDLAGNDMKPDTLNDWLKGQSDGYIGPGLVNWLAITRYVKQSYDLGHAETKLEFVRSYLPTPPVLPAILGLPGHFVVAHSEDVTNWKINDPNNTSRTTLAKTSTVNSVNKFIPSLTDLSYMMFATKPGLIVTMRGFAGNVIPMNWTEEYLTDDVAGIDNAPITTSMLPKPADGKYTLYVNNPMGSSQSLATYLYDRNGEVSQDDLYLPPMTSASFIIQYSANPSQSSPITLDYTSIFDYLKSLREPKFPANGIFQALYGKFKELLTSTNAVSDLNKFITLQSPKNITPEVKTRLQNYIMLIKEN